MGQMQFDHIGIAVENIDGVLPFFTEILGFEDVVREEVPAQGVTVAKIRTGRTTIELLQPLGEDGPIRGFLDRKGEGIHHIAFETDDALARAEQAGTAGVKALSNELKPGASGKKVLFFHPKTTFGTLIELCQRGGK